MQPEIFELPNLLVTTASQTPEKGMGYQEMIATFPPFSNASGVVLCGHLFYPESPTQSPSARAYADTRRIFLDTTPPKVISFTSPVGMAPHLNIQAMARDTLARAPTIPPFETKTVANDVFYRLTAFKDDRRVTPDRGLRPQSYTTTSNDYRMVPSGLAAVGRYALPSPFPAIHLFIIQPPEGTRVAYGTVRPDFGMAGGGVEAYFPDGSPPGTVTYCYAIDAK